MNASVYAPSIRSSIYDTLSLPTTSVVIIFCNEDLELLLRSVYSVLDRTPPVILREIVLVDDYSDDKLLLPKEFGGKGQLQEYVAELPKVRYVRLDKRGGQLTTVKSMIAISSAVSD